MQGKRTMQLAEGILANCYAVTSSLLLQVSHAALPPVSRLTSQHMETLLTFMLCAFSPSKSRSEHVP